MPEITVNSEAEAMNLIRKFIDTFTEQYSYAIQEEAQMILDVAGITDTGYLSDNIVIEQIPNGFAVISKAPYSLPVEYGSAPHWAPIEPLKGWARRKLGDEQAAYAVQQKIAKKGTKASPFMEPSIDPAFDIGFDRAYRLVFT